MKKKLFLLLSLVLCIVFMAGCGKEDTSDSIQVSDDVISTVTTTTTSNFNTWVTASFTSSSTDETLDEDTRNQYKTWQDLKDKLGTLRNQTEVTIDLSEDGITTTIDGEFDNGKIEFTMTFDLTGNPESVTVDEIESKGEIMEKAILNTLMGMGTVFVILILISLVISCFGIIGKQQAKKAAAAKASQQVQTAPVVMAPVMEEQKNLTDDLELVAVVTAAIMASMGDEAPAEGLVVRSIKKRNASKWKNA